MLELLLKSNHLQQYLFSGIPRFVPIKTVLRKVRNIDTLRILRPLIRKLRNIRMVGGRLQNHLPLFLLGNVTNIMIIVSDNGCHSHDKNLKREHYGKEETSKTSYT